MGRRSMIRPMLAPTMARDAVLASMLQVACVLAAATAQAGVACPGYDNMLFCADLTNDCKVTAPDALSALRMAVGQTPARAEADLDNSGVVTAPDALRILRVAVGDLPATSSCGRQYGLNAEASGFYDQDGGRVNNNYAIGWYVGGQDELRNYLVFDLSPVGGTIESAMLHLSPGTPVYGSEDASETYTLFDIETDIDSLVDGAGGTAAFEDLGEGTIHGTRVVTSAGTVVIDVPLNAAGIAHLDGLTGEVALGGAMTTLVKGIKNEFLFNSTGLASTRQLIVTVE